MKHDRLYPLSHAPVHFHFRPTPADFVVTEIPLYPFSGSGEHLVLKVRKKGLTTWEMLEILSGHLGVKAREIGYAGLKDKHAMTVQSVSVPASIQARLDAFDHPQVKILETTRHTHKIRMGHLKGNRFFIRLKKVSPTDAAKMENILDWIRQNGLPNYFGYQRFGKDGDNFELAKAVASGEKKMRNRKKRDFLMSAWQSHLFNLWLAKRVEIGRLFAALKPGELKELYPWHGEIIKSIHKTPHFFKLLPGDLMEHYPHGKLFMADDITAEAKRFEVRSIAPTGPLPGRKCPHPDGLAWELEKDFFETVPAPGGRRYAWVWPEAVEGRYKKEVWHYELAFTLPKGSYATVLLEMLANRPLREEA